MDAPTRWKLLVEYDGRGLVGWQRQAEGVSVQGALEAALRAFTGETVTVTGAGRTDAGVHATGQVAHVDVYRALDPKTVRDAANHHLKPHAIAVVTAEPVASGFDARRSAVIRGYVYRILNRRAPPAYDRGRVWHVVAPLDAEAMHAAAQGLVGRHDFSSFRAAECQALSPVRTLDSIAVTRAGDELRLAVRARSFLHNQVRIMAGTLRKVGEGKWSAADVAAALAACDRAAAGQTAPPHGLCLAEVQY